MKAMKKMLALLLALTMVFALSATAFAAGSGEGDSDSDAAVEGNFKITIKNENPDVNIGGHKFQIYQIFDVSYTGENTYTYRFTDALKDKANTFTYEWDGKTYFGDRFTNPGTPDLSLMEFLENQETESAEMHKFANALLAWAKTNATAKEVPIPEGSQELTVDNLPAGYYLVTGEGDNKGEGNDKQNVLSSVTLTTTDPAVTIQPKLDVTRLDKKATGDHVLNDAGKAAEAQVGESVPFELHTQIPDVTGWDTYKFTIDDTLSPGLTFDQKDPVKSSVVITYKDKDGNYVSYDNYTVEVDGQMVTIDFPKMVEDFKGKTELFGNDIKIVYSATLNENALEYDWENNSAKLTYGNKPNTTPEQKVYVYDFDIEVDKFYMENGEKKPLEDAWFALRDKDTGKYYKLNEGNPDTITWVDMSTILTNYAEATDKDALMMDLSDADLAKVDAGITLGKTKFDDDTNPTKAFYTFKGLRQGTYELIEVKAPTGYNKLTEVKEVTISIVVDDTTGEFKSSTTVESTNEGQLTHTEEIENKSGNKLPETGGMGTTLFYVIGSVLMLGAAVLLITKKRVNM